MSGRCPFYEEIFARNIGIYTLGMQELLEKSTVAVAGVGGVGGITAVTLARNGIGHLKIADPEVFEDHNINRQYGALISTLGRKKVEVMEEILKDINPYLQLKTYPQGVGEQNIEDFLDQADVVIDAIEYNAPKEKLKLYQKAREAKLYVLSSPVSGFGSLVFCFDPQGIKVEEIFGFPTNEDDLPEYKIPPERLIGCTLDYVPPTFLENIKTGKYIPSNGSACALAASAVSVDVLKILLLHEKERNPQTRISPHLEEIPLIIVPHARRYDLWDYGKDKIIDLKNLR